MITKKNIWHYKQNKPTFIVKDIKEKYPQISEDFIYEVLLKRGVFKWLNVRRELIKLKIIWKKELTLLMSKQSKKKEFKRSGKIIILNKCKEEIKKLCHSERFVAPDFDREANNYLRKISSESVIVKKNTNPFSVPIDKVWREFR